MLYFVPSESPDTFSPSPEELGIAHAFDGAHQRAVVYRGPNGEEPGGIIYVDRSFPGSYADLNIKTQTWLECDKFWVGCDVSQFSVEAYARPVRLRGDVLQLGGHEFRIPTAVSFEEVNGELQYNIWLDRHITLIPGTLTPVLGGIVEQFCPLFELAEKWSYRFNEAGDTELTYVDLRTMAAEAISFNYRLGLPELALLGLLTDGRCVDILDIVVDTSGWESIQKKTAPDSTDIEDGAMEVSETILPASPKSS